MILDGVIKGAEKLGRNNVIPEVEIERLEKIDRKPGRPFKPGPTEFQESFAPR